MLFTGNFPILRCGIEAGMAQMLLKQSQCISGVIQLHSVHTKGISKAMRANTSSPTSLRVHQIWKARFFRTIPHYLPSAMAVKVEELHSAIATVYLINSDIVLQQLKRLLINR